MRFGENANNPTLKTLLENYVKKNPDMSIHNREYYNSMVRKIEHTQRVGAKDFRLNEYYKTQLRVPITVIKSHDIDIENPPKEVVDEFISQLNDPK